MSAQAVYIASDQHLGVPNAASSLQREKLLVQWLEHIRHDAQEIILLGDLFDFWFEYKTVVPKGFVRLLGKLAEIADSGVRITLFWGNHDQWHRDYFERELGIETVPHHREYTWFERRYYLHHGDGKGPGDHGYKLFKWFMRGRLTRWLYRWVHPDWGTALALWLSRRSRSANAILDEADHGPHEYLVQYVQRKSAEPTAADVYVFGHRHMARRMTFNSSELIVLGDWITHFSYLRIGAATGPQLLTFRHGTPEPLPGVITELKNDEE